MIGCFPHPIPNAKFEPITTQKELCLIIIKVPKAPLHHVPGCYGPIQVVNKLTLASQQLCLPRDMFSGLHGKFRNGGVMLVICSSLASDHWQEWRECWRVSSRVSWHAQRAPAPPHSNRCARMCPSAAASPEPPAAACDAVASGCSFCGCINNRVHKKLLLMAFSNCRMMGPGQVQGSGLAQ